ncbi:MAG: MFS transporter [Crocinitomicaceae bacterium]|nr:MFS transporter [Crocinitomicaceae bacterium]
MFAACTGGILIFRKLYLRLHLAIIVNTADNQRNRRYPLPFAGLTILFFMWGFITVMNDVLINSFGELFNLKPTELSYIQLTFFGGFFVVSLLYFIVSASTGRDPINRLGYKNGMSISLLVCGLGCGLAYLASLNTSYPQFIMSLFVLSVGVTLLQICANPYATILGPQETASSRLNLAQGFNSLGTTLGPIVGSILIFSVFSDGVKTIASVGLTYLIYGAVFTIMAFLVWFSKFPAFVNEESLQDEGSILKHRHLIFGIIAIFFYVGSEVSLGSWIGSFAQEEEIMGMDDKAANYFLAYFWGGLMIGRLTASISLNNSLKKSRKYLYMLVMALSVFVVLWIVTGVKIDTKNAELSVQFSPLHFKQLWIYLCFIIINFLAFIWGKGNAARLIVIFSSINIVLLSIGILGKGELAFWAILGTGLFLSIGWSNIFSLSIRNLGKMTSQGSSLLVMAIVGGAALPWIQSNIIEEFDVQTSFIIPLLGMIYLVFFGLYGYKSKPERKEALDSP